MTRQEFEEKYAHVLDEHVNCNMAYELNKLLDDYELILGDALALIRDMPCGLRAVVSKEAAGAVERLGV